MADDAEVRTRFATARGAVALAVCVGVLCELSITFTRQPGGLSNLWPASGIVAGVLLTTTRSRWNVYIVASLLANIGVRLLHVDSWYSPLVLGAASTFDAVAVAYVLRRFADDIFDVSNIVRISKLATGTTLAACAASALISSATLAIFRGGDFFPLFATWFSVHSIGMVIFATLTVVARAQGVRVIGRPGQRLELVLHVLIVMLTSIVVFAQSRYPLLFVILPVTLLTAFRYRFNGFVLSTSIVSIVALVGTLSGHGPLMLSVDASPAERTFVLQLFIGCICALTLPVAIVLTQRQWLERRLAESESEYRMLAEYSRDLVVRIDAQGKRKYISPSASEILGWDIGELREERWDLIHVDDRASLMVAMAKLRVEGGSSTVVYRVQHRDGRYIWIEAHARLIPTADPGQPADIIYAGRDISRRIKAEQDLARNQRRLRAIADNTPAFVIHIDTDERYTFANAYAGKMLGVHPGTLIGRSLRDIGGEKAYAEIKPHIDAVMRGETVTFETERDFAGGHQFYQCTYVPDRAPDGELVGFYAMVFDISNLKIAEHKLEKLARHDSLTGLANRFQFNERTELAIARRLRHPEPIALLYLDIDHFKQINDTLGHAAGDAILVEFARRLSDCVRDTDLVARLGGDEFVVLIEDIDSPIIAQNIARKLIERLSTGILIDGRSVSVTTSIGIAFRSWTISSADQLLKFADEALYEAKAAGRNTFRIAK
jgi:diguanylate cyclase (GGDEF)-like protein/PAS domain S-box-containing protein